MNVLAAEWADKAEADYRTAGRELKVIQGPNYDAVCFHAQQMAEKYLKALLQERAATFPRTHNLIELLELCLLLDGSVESQRSSLILLDRYAVRYRYPGDSANQSLAQQAFAAATRLRAFLRQQLAIA
ncbi:MAG: HEPN domain-containing protein [Dehalococcoidia bacterium]